MTDRSSMKMRGKLPAYFILAGGLLVLIFLILIAKEGVFFSGDAGVKFLMVRQMQAGGSATVFAPAKPDWIQHIWGEGFFPLGEPFVYQLPKARVVAFPPAFQWLSLPFYSCFGYTGLLILPAIALIALWAWFLRLVNKIVPGSAWLFLAALVYCSPLTIYGGLYWEHTIAVLLCFSGIVYFIKQPAGFVQPLMYGLVCGAAIWFRPEALIFCSLTAIAAVFPSLKKTGRPALLFIGGIALGACSFLLFNYICYGSPVGVHGLQLLNYHNADSLRPPTYNIFTHLNLRLIGYFPASLFFGYVLYKIYRKEVFALPVYQLTFIISCFLLVTPFFVPNAGGKQWAARYLLPLIPVILVLYALVFARFESPRQVPITLRMAGLLFLLCGFYLNIFWACDSVQRDYNQRVLPALSFVLRDSTSNVIVQNQYITQEMAAAFEKKNFFVAENGKRMDVLTEQLKKAGISSVLYISPSAHQSLISASQTAGHIALHPMGSYFVGLIELNKR